MSVVVTCSVLALTAGALLLALAGPGHVRHHAALTGHLRRHGVLPAPLIRVTAAALGPYEALLGTATPLLWLAAHTTRPEPGPAAHALHLTATATGWAVTVTYALFTVYLVAALRRAPGAPCACFGPDEPLTWAVPARSAVFAVAALPALWARPDLGTAGDRVTIAAAATVLAALAWALPMVVDLRSATAEQRARRGQ